MVFKPKDHLISPEPVQENHEVPEERVTPIIEQGMNSRASFAEEAMKDKKEEDLIFKKLNIPWLSNQDSTLHGEVYMDLAIENLRKRLQQHKSQIDFLNETNDRLVMTNRRFKRRPGRH